MNIGEMGVPFIYQGEELIYPEYVKDGLVLHYDFSGMTNNDATKGIATDLSGNGNHGTLQNFNFTPESGYDKNKLLFDGVDDEIIISGLETNASFSIFSNIAPKVEEDLLLYSFSSSNTYLRVEKDGRLYFFAQSFDGTSNYYNGIRSTNVFDNTRKILPIGVVVDKDLIILYADGVEVGRGNLRANILPIALRSIGKWNSTYTKPVFSSVKYYNRPLTPEEIAHNYAIEKERFGIE